MAQRADSSRVRLFVLTPAARVDDSVEALHQFVRTANVLGYDASTVYLPGPAGDPTPEAYRSYVTEVAPEAVDSSTSFVVAPPGEAGRLLDLRAAQRGMWWLRDDTGAAEVDTEVADTLRDPKARCIHLTPSAQHRRQLSADGTPGIVLTDYLPGRLVELGEQLGEQPKDDLVVYHAPGRGKRVEALRSRLPTSVDWVPLPAQDPEGAARTLGRAKVFLDLTGGGASGRAARTATLVGCCVLASGTPATEDDPGRAVPEQYRLRDDGPAAPAESAALIAEILANHAEHVQHHGDRRDRILGQERTFCDEAFVALATVEAFQHRVQHLTLA